MLIRVTSPHDPRLAAYRDIKDAARAREGGFLVEGEIALQGLFASRFEPVSVFLSENRAEKLAASLPDLPVFTAPQPVMDAIAGIPLHRGVLALAKRGPDLTIEDVLRSPPPQSGGGGSLRSSETEGAATILVAINLANHDNIGACFRNAAALGASAILLDATSGDPLYRKSIRVSSGAVLTLPFAQGGDAHTILDALDKAGFATWALTPTNGEPLHATTPPPRLALILGAEGPGLPPDILARCRRISIPMHGAMDSLNVATAGAIALAHVSAHRS